MNSDPVGPGGGTKHQHSLGLLKGICTFKCISLESTHPQHLFHDPLGTRADTLANLPLVCRGEHAKTGVGLAKNEAFSAPSSFLFSFVMGERSTGIPKAHVQNGMASAWSWGPSLPPYPFIRAESFPAGLG